MVKWLFDKVLALFLIVLFMPLFIIIFFVIFLSMGLPVFFKQERPGYKEKIFTIYKFRTMNDKRDNIGALLDDERRVTNVGRVIRSLSLDELPQLFNVLKGDMSFVGPRPLLVEYLKLYNNEQKKRHSVKPGITGWAQVNGRNAIGWEDKFKYDIWYVENQSFTLDMKILWLTFLKVLKRSDIGSATEKFKGTKE